MLDLEAPQKLQKRQTRPRKNSTCLVSLALLFCLVLVSILGLSWLSGRLHQPVEYASFTRPNLLGHSRVDTHYNVMGVSTISVIFINQVLDAYGSPAAGKGQALYDLGVQYGVDPIYALAFFMHESSFGTTGVAQVTLSLGNIRATPGYDNYQGYRKYKTWEEGFADFYKLIKEQYVGKWQISTVDQIIPVYAPSSDNNDVTAYIRVVKQAVDAWRNSQVQI